MPLPRIAPRITHQYPDGGQDVSHFLHEGMAGPLARPGPLWRYETVFRGIRNVPRGSMQHSAEVWDQHKNQIYRLYIEEGRTLGQVVELMAQQGFGATERMYKKRIKEWKFGKNRRVAKSSRKDPNSEKWPVRQVAFRRSTKPSGSQPPIAVGGTLVDDHRLLESLTSPDTPRFVAAIVGGLQDILSHHCHTLGQKSNRGVNHFLNHVGSESRQAVNDLIQASCFFEEGQVKQGSTFAKKAFNSLMDFLTDQHLFSLLYLFVSIPYWKDSGLMGLVWKCLASNASDPAVLGPHHRLSILLGQMHEFYKSYGASEFASVVTDSMKAVFQVIEDMGIMDDFCVTWLKCDYGWLIHDRIWTAKLLSEVISFQNSFSTRPVAGTDEAQVMTRFMYLQLQVVRKLEGDTSERTFETAEEIAQKLAEIEYGANEIRALCFRTMSRYHKGLCVGEHAASDPRHDLARYCLTRATIFDEAHWGLGQKITIDDLKRLEEWNAEAERWEDVQAARMKWTTAMWILSENSDI